MVMDEPSPVWPEEPASPDGPPPEWRPKKRGFDPDKMRGFIATWDAGTRVYDALYTKERAPGPDGDFVWRAQAKKDPPEIARMVEAEARPLWSRTQAKAVMGKAEKDLAKVRYEMSRRGEADTARALRAEMRAQRRALAKDLQADGPLSVLNNTATRKEFDQADFALKLALGRTALRLIETTDLDTALFPTRRAPTPRPAAQPSP